MAGYIFTLDNINSLELYLKNGIYATKLYSPNGYWRPNHEGTFADYVTMNERDNVYFFIQRKIYGIGKLITINGDCKYFNYPNAGIPKKFIYSEIKESLLWDEGDFSTDQRFVCTFLPDPYFFREGVDMDDVLFSNPRSFKMLRAFWRLSFIKFDDEENQAFRDVILKFNQDTLIVPSGKNTFKTDYKNNHAKIKRKLKLNNYKISLNNILSSCAINDKLGHEMALEVALLHQLAQKDASTIDIFKKWDYLSHQVIASPFKPVDYMDKIDIFGYSYIEGYKPTKSKYLIIELKKDTGTSENLNQLMKYVDWVTNEYCYGDYSMIKAFLVAFDFTEDIIKEKNNIGIRKYTIGMRPAKSMLWDNLTLVKYLYNQGTGKIEFQLVIDKNI